VEKTGEADNQQGGLSRQKQRPIIQKKLKIPANRAGRGLEFSFFEKSKYRQ